MFDIGAFNSFIAKNFVRAHDKNFVRAHDLMSRDMERPIFIVIPLESLYLLIKFARAAPWS